VHPKYLVSDEDMEIVRLFFAWRDHNVLPFAGGAAEQPCLVMDAFDVVAAAVGVLSKKPGT
jgi:hypothetical protein